MIQFKDYFKERNYKSSIKINEILATLPFFCQEFFVGIENQTSCLTRLNYAQDLKIFFSFLSTEILEFHDKPIKDFVVDDLNNVSSNHLEIFLSYLSGYYLNGKYFSNTEKGKARKLATIRSFFKYFYKKGEISTNVPTKIDTPKIHEKDIIRLETDEVDKLIKQTEDPKNFTKTQLLFNKKNRIRDTAIVTLLLGTGMRVSECVGLNLEDIDFNTNSLKITRKGGNQTILYFSHEVEKSLKDYLNQRDNNKNIPENERGFFLSMQNKRITVRAVENLVKKYSTTCIPLKNITPHKLRSTFGTNLYRETKDIYIVADVLGHKDVNTTKKHYAAISEDSRKNVANIVKLRRE